MTFHPRIHPVNYPLLRKLPEEHPAALALRIHAEARDVCVGKEIDWPDDWPHREAPATEQVWLSDTEGHEYRFSTFAYQYISFDLFLDGWASSAPEATETELKFLENVTKMRALLSECERAAREEQNHAVLPLIAKARQYIDAREQAVLFRFEQHGIERRENKG